MVTMKRHPNPKEPKAASRLGNLWRAIIGVLMYEATEGEALPWYYFFKHRYYRLVSYLLACCFTTLAYTGWASLRALLLRMEARSWTCLEGYSPSSASEVLPSMPQSPASSSSPCAAQAIYFDQLLNVALGCESLLGAIAGLSYDRLGPFLTALLGEAMFLSGWICLAVSRKGLELYIPGVVLLSGAVNMVAIPTLLLSDIFPKFGIWITSIVVGAQYLCSLIPALLDLVDLSGVFFTPSVNSPRQLIWIFVLCVALPCAAVFLISVPLTASQLKPRLPRAASLSDVSLLDSRATTKGSHRRSSVSRRAVAAAVDIDDSNPKHPSTHVDDISNVHNTKVSAPSDSQGFSSRACTLLEHSPSRSASCYAAPHATGTSLEIGISPVHVTHCPSLRKQILSPDYTLFMGFYGLQLLLLAYYQTSVQGGSLAQILSYLVPVQGLLGPIVGFVEWKTSSLFICMTLCYLAVIMYVIHAIGFAPIQYGALALYTIVNAYIFTTKYSYVTLVFPPTHFGVLVGCMGGIAGALTLGVSFVPVPSHLIGSIIYGGCSLLSLACVFLLQKRQSRSPHGLPPRSATAENAAETEATFPPPATDQTAV